MLSMDDIYLQQSRGGRSGIKENIPPPTPEEVGVVAKLGQYEDKRKRLQEERRNEYNQQSRTPGRQQQQQVSPLMLKDLTLYHFYILDVALLNFW